MAVCIWGTGALTVLSATAYLSAWLEHMASYRASTCAAAGAQEPSGADQARRGFAGQDLVILGRHANRELETRTSRIAPEADLTGGRGDVSDLTQSGLSRLCFGERGVATFAGEDDNLAR